MVEPMRDDVGIDPSPNLAQGSVRRDGSGVVTARAGFPVRKRWCQHLDEPPGRRSQELSASREDPVAPARGEIFRAK